MDGVFDVRPGAGLLAVADDHFQDQHGVLDGFDGIATVQEVVGEGLDGRLVRHGNIAECGYNEVVAEAGVNGVGCFFDVLAFVGLPKGGLFNECGGCHSA